MLVVMPLGYALLELVSRTELPLPATPLRDVALCFACHRG
jgi:hypothetical protein